MTSLVLALLVAAAPAAPLDSAAALARGRALLPAISQGDAPTLWAAFSDHMRSAMIDSATFVKKAASLHAATGTLDSLIDEQVTAESGDWVYRARAGFHAPPIPLLVTIALAPDGRVDGLALKPDASPSSQPYPSAFLDYQTKTPLRLPFSGEWYVFWGGRTLEQNYHASVRSQRFAYDLVMRRNGVTHRGDGRALADYYCYGQPVLAPAAGSVTWTENARPEQPIGQGDPEHPIGNGVILDHGNGEFSLLAHLQPGSVTVRPGDRVKAGQVLGRCGNSGNTSEPHLHYHLQDGPDLNTAAGLPAFFQNLAVDGKPMARAEIVKGQTVRPGR